MRKKQLLSLPKLEATEHMVRTAQDDEGTMKKLYEWWHEKQRIYEHDLYFRAVVREGILKVAMFTRMDLINEKKVPRLEIYINKKEDAHITYLPQEGKWSGARISYLDINRWVTNMDDWEEPGARKLVNDYLQNGEIRIYNAVEKFQTMKIRKELTRKHQAEKDRIDAVMDLVPDLPKDFESWIYHSAYSTNMYMLYHPGSERAWCTACGKEVKRPEKSWHRITVTCPNCHKQVMSLSWNKQKTLQDRKIVGILQKLKDGSGFCLSTFTSMITRRKETDWKLNTSESGWWKANRIVFDKKFNVIGRYEWGDFKNTHVMRWCYWTFKGYYSLTYIDECVLYHRNLKNLRKGTDLRYVPIELMYSHNQGCIGYVAESLLALRTKPGIEYLIKAGLYRLAWDSAKRTSSAIDWKCRKIWQALRIRKDRMSMCVRMNITELQLETLQKAEKIGVSLTEEQLRFYAKEFGPRISPNLWSYGHVEKMRKYFGKKKLKSGDYVDYLDELRRLRIPATEDVLFPQDFQAAHERTSQMIRERKDAIEKKKIAEKDRILKEMLPMLEEIYLGTRADEYLMILPSCKEDFNREGRENHNCVGGIYYDRMLEGKSVVLFLRNKEEPEKAFCTVEMEGSTVKQCRAIRNSEPPQEVKDFMEKYSREIGKRIMKKNKEAERQRVMVAV